jgi:hypothetical protein
MKSISAAALAALLLAAPALGEETKPSARGDQTKPGDTAGDAAAKPATEEEVRKLAEELRRLEREMGISGADRGSAAKGADPTPAQTQGSGTPAKQTPETALPRETAIENPLGRSSAIAGSAFGGYGELTLNKPSDAPGVVDLRRFVLFFGHDFTEHIRFYSEVEVEHAVSSAEDQGEVEIEQAYLDGLLDRRLNLRGGLILMPAGIINVYHEPPSFNGVDRPDVDNFVIPTTWREPGIGIFGELAEGLRYQLYFVNGFDANGFTAESAIREGHQEAQLAHAGDFGGILRFDYEPILGTVLGFSAYGATSRNTLPASVGDVPVGLFEVDVRTRRGAFSARAEAALLLVGDAGALNQALAAGTPEQAEAGPVSSQSRGGYVELAYDLLQALAPASSQGLTAFARFDYTDTQADVPAGFEARLEFRRYSEVVGLVYRPIPQIALKVDYRRRQFGEGAGTGEVASGITWLF